jgi:hypothetical protein
MPPSPGIFWMETPRQLFNKMVNDANHLATYHLDPAACFNFFVTAEHMADWLWPGAENNTKRKKLKESDPVLKICSQVANGAKHFRTEAKRHNSINATSVSSVHSFGASDPCPDDYEFVIHLNAPDAVTLGCQSLTVRELVKRVLDFWEPHVGHLPMFNK